MLSHTDKLKLLRINSFVGEAPLELLSEAAHTAVERSFDQGQLIYARDEPTGAFYVLAEGKVGHPEVHGGEEGARLIDAPGQMFGYAGARRDRHTLSARCETATRVLALDGAGFAALCSRHGQADLPLRLAVAHEGYADSVLGRSGWISVRNVSKRFDVARGAALLDDCSFEVRPGEFWAVAGPKDRGKTVLLNLIAGFEQVSDGVIVIDGEVTNRAGMRPRHGPEHVIGPLTAVHVLRATVGEHLREVAAAGTGVEALCEQLDLAPFVDQRLRDVPREISRQVELLRAFLRDPFVVLDEPARDLDASQRAAFGGFVRRLHTLLPRTTLYATEDIDEALALADKVLAMAPAGRRKLPVAVREAHGAVRPEAEPARTRQRIVDALAGTEEAAAPRMTVETVEIDEVQPARELPRLANALKEAIHEGRFFWTIEFIPSVDKVLHDALHKLGGVADLMRQEPELAGFSVTDRVVSDRDPEPVGPAARLLAASCKQPLVHFSGKGRDIADLHAFIERMRGHGLENALLLTGDRLREERPGVRARYLESVPAIRMLREKLPDALIAAALNPFKYREEDAMAQYLKLGKKVGAGADFIVTQIGFDMHKYEEALFWVGTRNHRVPLVANLLPMGAARARYLRHHQLAGVTITDSFLALLEAEERVLPDKGAARVLRRLALQILGVRTYGYAGVQLTGIHSVEKLAALRAELELLAELCSDRITWNRAWDEALTLPEGGHANPAPSNAPWYLVNRRTRHARRGETLRYKAMDLVHAVAFDRGLIARLLGPALAPITRHGRADRVLERIERAIKAPLFGCESCGMCRLAATQYVCPETCPKGLANGACGGTTENLCEFRDRECIHSAKYRIANDLGLMDQLERWLIPAVPQEIRGTSSWPAHFRGEAPKVEVIDFAQAQRKVQKGW